MTPSRTALILGATGGIGGETADALARHGWHIRALARDPAAGARGRPDFDWRPGDALDARAVGAAAEGVSLIVHAVNPPGYRGWKRLVLPMLESSLAAARAGGARLLLPGTIYNYGPDAFPLLGEESPQTPATRKGAIRLAMEARLEAAAREGVRSLILRAGDYFGPRPGNGWFSQGLVTPGRPVTTIMSPGRAGVGHAWAYLPDVAETFARLASREQELGPFARFHFAGHWDATGTEIVDAIRRAVGDPAIPVRPLPWSLLPLAAPFNETMRELLEMRGFWRAPVALDNARLAHFLGSEPHTPLDEAVRQTLIGLDCLPRPSMALAA
ncbi:MAG: NAD(P)H-binding protein [Caulobacter sp.]|nr:NAD(P)H-binding protein [Caulobacter sp.]